MDNTSYKQFWNKQARTPESAMFAVDGSTNEEIVRRTGEFAARQIMAVLEVQPDDRILDLGCGLGRVGRQLAPHCAQWVGVDISGDMIRHARERMQDIENVTFQQLESSSLDMFPSDSFDKAYSTAVLCHMDNEDLFLYLEELRRVLKPGGLVYVDTWNLAHPTGWKRWLYEVRFWQRGSQSERKDVARNQFCTPDELRLYARHAGLEVLACFDESHWLQLAAGKQLSDPAAHIQRIESAKERIVYSPLFADFFEKTCEVIYGETHPREVIAYMDRHRDEEEHGLFQPFIRGLWAAQSDHWGQPED